ncbi:MAG: threonine--tRNA ligase [Candidatus Vogelbacteria bacterium RIFOXYD2_FULL_44_9]|uniref:Threonine--tRNA ligase n=1 Tax=Candidatus Vogelbacteria bacterium RIFOXYD2_FULL_44_9 TaxID=1802441 RepID=A0A1G2QPN8_9BACT|nr:MAG: threonine--tRNA ligase [Candidatus Vogelbacteria bacterium RIFOXYD2_FULL_44_9]
MNNIENIRHSLAHLLATVVKEKYPEAKLGIGPAIDNGFYYDFDFSGGAMPTEENLKDLEKAIKKLTNKDIEFKQEKISVDEARAMFASEPYKLELIDDLVKTGQEISIYCSGDFVDLCAGPHVGSIKEINPDAFKLERVAGAYWKGSEKNKMLTRIYGLAFTSAEELKTYLTQIEEAKKRDHRVLGKQLKIFTISPLVGAGLPLMQPNGMIIRQEIEDYLWKLHQDRGYQRVWTPHIAHEELYQTSGHAEKFGDELFRVSGKEEKFILKPMNCPHHMQIFADNQFSYRDLPIRYFEPATVYRDEKSGQLSGLTRVRSITQDDGHLFCRISQIKEEIKIITGIIKTFYTTIGLMEDYWVSLSVRGDDQSKYLGTDEAWQAAETALEEVAMANNLPYKRIEGEAAFYGPKLDFMFKDAIGREWQLATIQCDFNLPVRFDLSFINEAGEKERPVVIHRAISGSLERFMGIMIEHYAGAFPTWLAPIQVKVLPITEKQMVYAQTVTDQLKANNIRVVLDEDNETLGKKIRNAKMQKIPYLVVIGDKELEEKMITVENRSEEKGIKMSVSDFADKISAEIKSRQA